MHKTRALSSLRNIFPPIHHQAPLNKNETQRMLDSIKESFRTQLDREYGWTSHHARSSPLPDLPLTYLPRDNNDAAAHSSARATDRHLHAILDNPLFSTAARKKAPETSDGTANAWELHNEIFSRAVSRGLMTLPRAYGFLLHIEGEVEKSPTLSVRDGLKKSGAGLQVLRWLQSSGMERELSFFDHRGFLNHLVNFLVAEGREDVVWAWIVRLINTSSVHGQPDGECLPLEHLFAALIRVRAFEIALDGSFAAMVRAADMLREKGLPLRLLERAWKQLAFQSTTRASDHTKPPVELFEPFLALGQEMPPQPLDMAHLHLQHPAEPSSRPAVAYLSSNSTWQLAEADGLTRATKRYVRRLQALSMDTLQHLLERDEANDASQLWNFLKAKLDGRGSPFEGFRLA